MNNYKITKIGLLNFWLYDEEEYDFFGGKLILRGTNGSGKSVTMQSFIPLILDGNKSPERLDPFGSKERRIEDYIIGSTEGIQKEEATSYLYMETYNKSENKYLTVGLGFRGRKGKGVDSWGFAIKDGKRIGKDFFLYKDRTNKIPLSKLELKTRLGEIDEFTETMKDYKTMVNRLLFGFPTIDAYDEFIKLLLQLRSNKLSKDYKPTNLVGVLNTVLQPLSEEELRPLTEAIESMNKTKEYIENLEKNSKSLNDFLKVYANYNEVVLLTKAREYQNKNTLFKGLKNKADALVKKIVKNKEDLTRAEERFNKIVIDIEADEKVKRELDNKDLKQKVEDLAKLMSDIEEITKKMNEIETSISSNEESIIDINKKKSLLDDDIYKLKKELKDMIVGTKDLYEDAHFDEIAFFTDELSEKLDEEYPFDSIFMSLKRHREKIAKVLSLLETESREKRESEIIRGEYEKLQESYKKTENLIEQAKDELKNAVLSWEEDFVNVLNNNKYLKLEDDHKKNIFEIMNSYEPGVFDKVKEIYTKVFESIHSGLLAEIIRLENKRDNLINEKNKIEIQKKEILNEKDIKINEDTFKTDKLLEENGIKFIPLYKVLEYKDNIKEHIKDKLESALLEMRILNAKIIQESDILKVQKLDDKIIYLKPSAKKANNLLTYFDIKMPEDTTFDQKYIKTILESISLDEKDLFSLSVNDNSVRIRMDFLNVIPDRDYKQEFIGYLKRKEMREKRLKELDNNISILMKEIDYIENTISANNKKIEVLKKEVTLLPVISPLNKITDKINEFNVSLNWTDQRQKELEGILKEIDLKLKKLRDDIDESSKNLYIPLNLENYKKASTYSASIYEQLGVIRLTHQNYLNKIDMLASITSSIERIEETIDYLRIDSLEAEKRLAVAKANKETIEELLKTDAYREQKEKLVAIEEELKNLVREKEELITKKATLNLEIDRDGKESEELFITLQKEETLLSLYRESFLREYELKYVYEEDLTDLDSTIDSIIKEGKTKKVVELSEALNKFYETYNHYNLELNEYSLKTVQLFADYDLTKYEDIKEAKQVLSSMIRTDITALYQGVKVNLLELKTRLNDDIAINRDLISKQDRHLFEDILINTVGEKIRDKIDSSKEWINKINNIMGEMQENSALSFKLVWESASAKDEGEIDTKEIVKLLKMDPKMLKDQDIEKLTNHFRSKIKKAEELYEDSYVSFYKIVEDILDYRSWFTFKLLYQRKGMERKELTDKTFSRFSGGERAKSMYIPLFASVYAKLILARDNSLRIIALDEAFAGVDEDNIREMFGILKYLDLDFIINSQVLWGDYDTVEDLSICELIRPQNSQVVTVERYRWNGQYKEIITRNNFDEELEFE